MSILSKLFSRILDPGRKVAQGIEQPTPGYQPQQQQSPSATSSSQSAPGSSGQQSAPPQIDVEAHLEKLSTGQSQKLDWRHSIVDLMKLVGMDSTLAERKELAKELGYKEDTADTARMNTWLHKEVMRKLAENGGKVPQNLLN
jgi:hypothetical protein